MQSSCIQRRRRVQLTQIKCMHSKDTGTALGLGQCKAKRALSCRLSHGSMVHPSDTKSHELSLRT